MANPIHMETERLTLRSLTQDDFGDMYRLLSDPDVMTYYPTPLSREEAGKWLDGILKDYETNGFGMLAAYLKETGEYIGLAGVMRRMPEGCERYYLSYIIRKEFWGHGYATEAARRLLDFGFETQGAQKIIAIIRPDNARSIHLAEKLGMQRESTMDLGGHEHLVYALTR